MTNSSVSQGPWKASLLQKAHVTSFDLLHSGLKLSMVLVLWSPTSWDLHCNLGFFTFVRWSFRISLQGLLTLLHIGLSGFLEPWCQLPCLCIFYILHVCKTWTIWMTLKLLLPTWDKVWLPFITSVVPLYILVAEPENPSLIVVFQQGLLYWYS